jgi:hypothetical protein
MSIGLIVDRHTDEVVRPYSTSMFVEYGVLGFIHEGGIDPTQTCDARNDFIFVLDYYREGMKVDYSLDHEDSMEVQLVELVHASTKKARDVKQSYGKIIWQMFLEFEHLQGIILYKQKCLEHWIDPLEFEAHKQEWETNNVGLVFV